MRTSVAMAGSPYAYMYVQISYLPSQLARYETSFACVSQCLFLSAAGYARKACGQRPWTSADELQLLQRFRSAYSGASVMCWSED